MGDVLMPCRNSRKQSLQCLRGEAWEVGWGSQVSRAGLLGRTAPDLDYRRVGCLVFQKVDYHCPPTFKEVK